MANDAYLGGFNIVDMCIQLSIPWAIENPASSLFWYLPEAAQLLEQGQARDAVYDACEFGGKRKKAQRIRTSCAAKMPR